ncbi:hypothetical protein ACVWZ4_006752 [Bradyrhizobium sp. USDA 4472]
MVNLFVGVINVALLAAGGSAVHHDDQPPTVAVRMVCDQNCNCWPTRYRERRPLLADRPDLACPPRPKDRPALGYYNGHYRTGPATGAGFDSLGNSELPFPF